MHNKLYAAWRREKLQPNDLQSLESDFFKQLSQYIRKMHEELRMLDEKTLKYKLLNTELEKAKKLTSSIIEARLQKLIGASLENKNIQMLHLADEEAEIYRKILEVSELCENLKKRTLEGRQIEPTTSSKGEMILIRFMTKIPIVVGMDMRSYGPFEPEDIATLPKENAEALIRQKVAIRIEAE